MAGYLTAEDIAEVLRREGDRNISTRTVHYYAEQRLLPPPDYHGARPRYTDAHLVAMRKARKLKRDGYSLEEIGTMILPALEASTPPSVQTALKGYGARYSVPAPALPSAPRTPNQRQRTLVVGDGLTLSISGWTDGEIAKIVAAIRTTIATLRQDAPAGRNEDEL